MMTMCQGACLKTTESPTNQCRCFLFIDVLLTVLRTDSFDALHGMTVLVLKDAHAEDVEGG